jgi:threonylcarbamoyladenosine tRNA methylthiotransferase MtaB
MVGFPGETEADFQATFSLLSELPFAYFHVFPYSPRPGTRAAEMHDSVPATEKAKRASQVRDLGRTKWNAFEQRHVGCVVESIVARKRDPQSNRRLAIAGNYLRPYILDQPGLVDQLAPVRITGRKEGRLLGVVEEPSTMSPRRERLFI